MSIFLVIYCRVPARWGLQQTHPGLRAATRQGVRDPLVHSQVDYLAITTYKKFKKRKRTVHLIRFLLRQGEPGTSQYYMKLH